MGRASCNSNNAYSSQIMPNAAFSATNSGNNCWCNMTGYQLNGQSAVNTNDSKWIYRYSGATCATDCAQKCVEIFDDLYTQNYENQFFANLFGSYGETAERCSPNSYNITWYDNNNTLTNNQCSYNDEFVLPAVDNKTGYNFMGFEVVQ